MPVSQISQNMQYEEPSASYNKSANKKPKQPPIKSVGYCKIPETQNPP